MTYSWDVCDIGSRAFSLSFGAQQLLLAIVMSSKHHGIPIASLNLPSEGLSTGVMGPHWPVMHAVVSNTAAACGVQEYPNLIDNTTGWDGWVEANLPVSK